MAVSVVMPALEMAQETGKLISWMKREGEQVRKGEMLLEVETDKAVVEIEAAADGLLAGVSAKIGDVIPVGQTIAWLLQPGESVPTVSDTPAITGRRTDATPTPVASATGATPIRDAGGARRVSPKARRMAEEHGVDLTAVRGSGPAGEILAADVLAAASAGEVPAVGRGGVEGSRAPSVVEPLRSIERLMAERTTASWTTIPHFFVSRTVDATTLNKARLELLPVVERSHGVRLTHTDLIVALVGRALRKHPRMNASWTPQGVHVHEQVHVAIAMAVEGGVVTGVVQGADSAAPADIAVRRRDLAARARAGRLQPADISGATFTISNLGMFDVDAFSAIIVPPQAAILAIGAIADRVVAVDGLPTVRPMVTLTVSADHRIVDGAGAAAFLNDVAALLASAGSL
jgi:pyruvate dehydrogenase E2 component (dihydrolipoamide acetyltransferase)